jgi:hypothetical protein
MDDFAKFSVYGNGYVQSNREDVLAQTFHLVERMTRYETFRFKDEKEIIVIAEYPNQPDFPAVRIKIKREVVYRATDWMVWEDGI